MQLFLSSLFANALQTGSAVINFCLPRIHLPPPPPVSIILQLLHIAYDVNASRIHLKVAFMVKNAVGLTLVADQIILLCCSFQWSSLSVHMNESLPTQMSAKSE